MANGSSGPLDSMFAKTNIIILVVFGLCCSGIAFILSLICVFTAKDEVAKKNAIITLIVSIVAGGGLVIAQIAGGIGGALLGH